MQRRSRRSYRGPINMVGKNSQEFRDRVPLRESPDRQQLKEEERKGRGRRLTGGVRLTVRGKERKGDQGRARLGPSAGLVCGLGRRGERAARGGKRKLGFGQQATRPRGGLAIFFSVFLFQKPFSKGILNHSQRLNNTRSTKYASASMRKHVAKTYNNF